VASVWGGIADVIDSVFDTKLPRIPDTFRLPTASFGNVSLEMPKLAQGAVIPPNREFMAVLGDQSNGRNLEAPESLIRSIVREESGGGAEMTLLLGQILDAVRDGQRIYVDGHILGQTAQRYTAAAAKIGG
jgi:hypothetical protein